jgi:exopolyphosphatase/guanosine-5'-triphosphate,3'-diphosphate pyrophosphatase
MKYASIDIGTNTVLLMIAEIRGRIEELYDTATITRLGEGLKQTGNLSAEAMERTLNALRHYKMIADKNQVEEILCVGTAALREAKNRDSFLELVSKELSFPIHVISEHDEAYYTYLSVRQGISEKTHDMVIIDVGGGSTEIIFGNRNNFIDYVSLPVGSVKLTEMFIKNDPPFDDEIRALRDFIKSILKFPFGKGVESVIGTAGTITTLGSIGQGFREWEKKRIHGLRLHRERIDDVVYHLLAKTASERAQIPGMEKGREDIIPQGIILLQEIMKYLGADELLIDANGVRHGILCERLSSLHSDADF